ncbi:abscisic acid 8'-hydroxylase 1 isoform X2 [Selaginella moellendorffii]|nr:abscisic acid 8'-hydroxylase 1 isoform X2 [Selaginella moellendorffii]|eukprot:XP_002975946.2 abscisic acid 8'-hydroxylase 1 isoform X2 [Selaginella moellendorffii]
MADLALLVLGSAMLLLLALLKLARRSYALGRLPLPPGTMGWPYLGETLQLYSQNPNAFFSSKQKRYGDIFKTHILGCPSVMIASPEAAKFILVSHAHLFKTTFPSSKEGIIGPHALFFHEGEYHRRLRRLVQGCFGPDVIRDLVPELETISIQALDSLDRAGGIINTFQEMKKYAFDVGVLKIFGGSLDELDKEDLKRAYQTLERGYNSFPIDIAGTPYNAAMKARKRLSSIVSRIILDRRRQQKQADNGRCKDFLSTLMESQDDSCKNLTDDQIADNVIGVIFAAQDTTASVLTWLLKYLKENPALLDSVTAEHENIRRSKPEGAKGLTWADTKNMPLTSRVIQETMRLATILSFTFREAVQDVEYNGYVIPKGWKVMPLFRNIHHSPEFFLEPQKFDPSRFEEHPKPNTFMPFGNGIHSCPGRELAKLEMLVLVHNITTQFRWEFAGPTEGVQYGPFPVPKAGLPISITRKSES